MGCHMNVLKGFINIPSLSNNKQGVIAQFGEFSNYSRTFSRDVRNYAVSAQPDVELVSMQCVDGSQNRVEPSSSFIGVVLAFGQWVFTQYNTSQIPADRNKTNFITAITKQFTSISNVVIGSLVTDTVTAGKNMPDYVTFNLSDGATPYTITLWFSDASFRTGYDVYNIYVIPPVDTLSVLGTSKLAVSNAISSRGFDTVTSQIQNVKGDLPETAILTTQLTWHDPSDTTSTLTTTWVCVIYGGVGTDNQAMKDAVRDYLAANSTASNWNTIYPDLYAETEFTIFPFWNKLALQPNALKIGVYSALTNNADDRNYVKTFIPNGYASTVADISTYIDQNLQIGTAVYRSLSFGAIGNPNNLNNYTQLTQLYPDYTSLPTTSADFARMSQSTQGFITMLNQALDVARTFSPTDALDATYSRVIRKGMYFISFNYNGYQYPILTKYAYDKTVSGD